MNFGTPAFALNYEHKSEGIMNQLGLGSFGIPLSELIDGTLLDKVKVCLENIESVREKVEKAVSGERERARRMVSLSFR
jgi:colanic acid/amylovoran biosynthesis protein